MFYFENDYPKPKTSLDYTTEYTKYTTTDRATYEKQTTSGSTGTFFDSVVIPNYSVINQLAVELGKQLGENAGNVTIYITSSCSAPATVGYNEELSKRRIDSMISFFATNTNTKTYIDNKRLIVKANPNELAGALGEKTNSQPKKTNQTLSSPDSQYDPKLFKSHEKIINCTDKDSTNTKGGDTQSGSNDIYTFEAMACRRSYISEIVSTLNAPQTGTGPE